MNPCSRLPLIVDIPDRGETAAQHMGREPYCSGERCRHSLGSGWVAEADSPNGGFVVVVPEGLAELRTSSEKIAALRQVVTDVKRQANIDASRVYLAGNAGGAEVALAAGCDNTEDWAGMAVSSVRTTCRQVGKVTPFIAFGSKGDATTFNGMERLVVGMLDLNGCNGNATTWRVIDESEPSAVCRSSRDPEAALVPCSGAGGGSGEVAQTVCTAWGDCEGKAGVAFCDVAAGGAPVGAPDYIHENGTFLNTPSVAWRFFKTLW